MAAAFPHLMAPLRLGPKTIRNRIVSTGHDTGMAGHDGAPGDQLIAYQRARARGGAGLIVIQVASVHETAFYTAHILQGHTDRCIPGYTRLAQAIHEQGGTCFAQLFHPGREMLGSVDGTQPVALSASAVPNERYHIKPRPMTEAMIEEIIEAYATTALRLQKAGVDGVEIVASHGYLPAQFLSSRLNKRTDGWGGSFENRLRFLTEVLGAVRKRLGPDMTVGARISGDDLDGAGLEPDESLAACEALARAGLVDYLSVVAGSSATRPGSYHIVPPMTQEAGYTAPYGRAVKQKVGEVPVIVTGRINQPQIAEQILARGDADACGMTRAMISDPEMPNKARDGRVDDIRACIACNQACAGHFFMGVAISCIQHPVTGREQEFESLAPATKARDVLVVGGGPAGMKAAAVAAARGHRVTLCEAGPQLGGQALLAQLLPSRAEFGGIVTNLAREMELAGVTVRLNTRVDRAFVEAAKPDAVVLATGARPTVPDMEGEGAHVVNAWQVLKGEANVGQSVVIADWRCDWIGHGLAEKLALDGCRVRLAFNGAQVGESLMQYMRDHAAGRMFTLGVELMPYARLYGADGDTVYFEHVMAKQPIICEGVDTLVTALGHEAEDGLAGDLESLGVEHHLVGDCLVPRTAEEAVLEGLKVGASL